MSLLKSVNFPKSWESDIGKLNKIYQNGDGCQNSLLIFNASKFSAFSEAIFREKNLLESVNI